MTAVMRFSWNAREKAYTANHGQHSYAVRPVPGGGWNLYVDGIARQGAATHKPLLRAAQDIARATGA